MGLGISLAHIPTLVKYTLSESALARLAWLHMWQSDVDFLNTIGLS